MTLYVRNCAPVRAYTPGPDTPDWVQALIDAGVVEKFSWTYRGSEERYELQVNLSGSRFTVTSQDVLLQSISTGELTWCSLTELLAHYRPVEVGIDPAARGGDRTAISWIDLSISSSTL